MIIEKIFRVVFSLLILGFVLCIFLLNTESIRHLIKIKLQQHLNSAGYQFAVEDIQFDFPHTIVLTQPSLQTVEHGLFRAEKVSFQISWARALLGKLSHGSFQIDAISSDKYDYPFPEQMQATVNWNSEWTFFQGTLERLLSSDEEWPYLIKDMRFSVNLPGKQHSLFTLSLMSPDVQIRDIVLTDAECHAEWDSVHQQGAVSLVAHEIQKDELSLSNVSLNVIRNGQDRPWHFKFHTDGYYQNGILADLKGTFSEKQIHLDRFHFKIDEHEIELKDPLTAFIRKDAVIDLAYGKFIVDGVEIITTGNVSLDDIQLKVELPNQSFEKSDLPMKGNISGSLFLEGNPANLQAWMDLAADSIVIDHPGIEKGALFQTVLSLRLLENSISIQGNIFDRNMPLLKIEGDYPVERQGSFGVMFSRNEEMDIKLSGKIDVARYLPALLASNCWMTGEAFIDLSAKGSYDYPIFAGNAFLKNGHFECWETGTILHDIDGEFFLSDGKILMRGLKAFDSQGGRLLGSGALELEENFPFHVNLALNHSLISKLDHSEIILSGDGIFSGNRNQALLKGEFAANRIDIKLTEAPEAINHDVSVSYVNQNDEEIPPTRILKPAIDWPVCFDCHIQNKGDILIYSKELHSEWKGDVKVTGCNTQPLLHGDFRVVKGDYLFNGKKLKLAEGTITFQGELSKKTLLYVVGEMEIDPIVAQVVLKGPLNNPSLLFRSNPPLAQREILSWILFGRGMGEITPNQGAELVHSLNELKESGGSNIDVLSRIKETFGIDRIDIKSGEDSEEISFEVGKYILPDIFLGIKRDMSSDVNRIGIEANLMKNIKFQCEVGDDAEGQLHLKWKHDY